LEVDANFRPEFKRINKSREIKYRSIYFISKNHRLIHLARKIFPENIRRFVKKQIQKISIKEEQRAPLDNDLYHYLYNIYYDEVVKISQYLNRDMVSFWGFERMDREGQSLRK